MSVYLGSKREFVDKINVLKENNWNANQTKSRKKE